MLRQTADSISIGKYCSDKLWKAFQSENIAPTNCGRHFNRKLLLRKTAEGISIGKLMLRQTAEGISIGKYSSEKLGKVFQTKNQLPAAAQISEKRKINYLRCRR